jgi:hypothetical protein
MSGLPQSFNCIGVAEQVRIYPFFKTCFLGNSFDYLPTPKAVDRKEPLVVGELVAEGVGLHTFGQS